MQERLQKIISQAGIASRRAAEDMILAGRVSVNGAIVTELGSKADPAVDAITVDNRPVKPVTSHLYILLNKPAGFMTTLDDPEGRHLVTDLLPDIKERVYPVGRLDYNTEGLLLLTNDGEWANKLMHPRHEVEKEYHVRVRGKAHQSQIDQLRNGVLLDDRPTAPATVRLIKDGEQNDWLSIIIHEGRNRQIRRMCEAVSLSVVRLKRVRYGILEMGALKPGQYRMLTEREVRELAGGGVPPLPVREPQEKKDADKKRKTHTVQRPKKKPSPGGS